MPQLLRREGDIMNKQCFITTFLSLFLAGSATASAAVLAPGATVQLDGLASLPPGTVLTQSTQTLDQNQNLQTLTATVFREDATGFLDFIYSLTITPPPNFELFINASATGFAGVGLDADYLTSTDALNWPSIAARSPDGNVVTFDNWLSGSNFIFAPMTIRTTATQYISNATFTTDIGVETAPPPPGIDSADEVLMHFQTFGPVPEPSTLALLTFQLILVHFRRFRRR
jgi:hypothetical protein